MKANLRNLKNEVVGTVELPAQVFNARWRPALVQQVLLAETANRRIPWAHAKGRAEVRGGGRKPWRQKGTGRARHGSIRSPLWAGGGKAHGPSKSRDYSQKVNKKAHRAAVAAVLSRKLKDSEITLFDTLDVGAPKTRILAGSLRKVLGPIARDKKFDALLIVPPETMNLFRAARNLPKVGIARAPALTVYDLLNHKHVFIDERALPILERQFAARP